MMNDEREEREEQEMYELDFDAIRKLKQDAADKQRTQANVVDGDMVESSDEE